MPRSLTYRELWKRLRAHDKRFEEQINRAKGSERMIFHPSIDGKPQSYPVKCHGEGTDIYVGALKAIIRRFKLPPRIFD